MTAHFELYVKEKSSILLHTYFCVSSCTSRTNNKKKVRRYEKKYAHLSKDNEVDDDDELDEQYN